jgi:hypothetical protein
MNGFGLKSLLVTALTLFAQAPSSSNFTLKAYDVGTGGGSSSSTNYKLNATTGTQTGDPATSASFGVQSGQKPTQQAQVPAAPTFTNPSNEYRRLRLTISTSSNASDTLYAIAISSDGFTTTEYVKNDTSIGATLALADYQSYAAWGGASGFWVTGLAAGTTYDVKVRAKQGDFTESAYGPTASASTVQPTISFSVETSVDNTPPFAIGFGSLTNGVVGNGSEDALIGISTNAVNGGSLFVRGSNGGLASASAGYTLTSATADLASASSGYGARVSSTSQVSGGPLAASSPFNGSGDSVGALTSSLVEIASTAGAVTTGSMQVQLKAKTSSAIPAANDYTDTLLFIAAMTF